MSVLTDFRERIFDVKQCYQTGQLIVNKKKWLKKPKLAKFAAANLLKSVSNLMSFTVNFVIETRLQISSQKFFSRIS